MNNKKNIGLLFILSLSLHSCIFFEEIKEDRRNIIDYKEVTINLSNRKDLEELRELYKSYANDFPNDLYAPEYLYRAARFEYASELKESIELLNKVIREYPESAVVPECYYEKAYIFDYVGEKDSADKAYQDLVNKFPNHYLLR